ncbi:MAG: hypothetical protein L7F78_04740 [Syntrophales bacterium LBB04]|nr:hypothetical protein [Syntrophales bacterium LBB04]
MRSDAYRLPIYTLTAGISFTLTQLYTFLIFAKAITNKFKKKRPNIYFLKNLKSLALYFGFLVFISVGFGMSMSSIKSTYQMSVNLTIFFSVFYIFSNEEEFNSFLRVIFPFVFVAVAFQFYDLTNHQQPIELFKPEATMRFFVGGTKWMRPIEMMGTLLICFSGSLYALGTKNNYFKRSYLVVIGAASFISIFLTGTRAWAIGFFLAFILYLIFLGRKVASILPKIIVGFLFTLFLFLSIPVLSDQFANAWDRLSTSEGILEGDLSLGGTSTRFEEHAPQVMEAFSNSNFFFGAGFSDYYYEHGDIHVGYHNVLFNVGIIGIFFFLALFQKIFRETFSRRVPSRSREKKLALIPLVMLLIINTGVQTIGYGVTHSTFFFLQAYTLALLVIAQNAEQNQKLTVPIGQKR